MIPQEGADASRACRAPLANGAGSSMSHRGESLRSQRDGQAGSGYLPVMGRLRELGIHTKYANDFWMSEMLYLPEDDPGQGVSIAS